MKFLISNDDGIFAPGLLALYEALSEIGEVKVVAPDSEQSGSASALHITQPLYAQKLTSGFIAVNGSPADCIYLALHELYRDTQFDCVITGINSGANLGQDVLFSGTFGAALTAQLFGIPAIATSLVGGGMEVDNQEQTDHYKMAAQEIVKLLTDTSLLVEIQSLPYHVLNVNIPKVKSSADIKGRIITGLSHSRIARPIHRVIDPRGRDAYWLSLRKSENSQMANDYHISIEYHSTNPSLVVENEVNSAVFTDEQAVAAGFISLSPVRLHHTPAASLDQLSALAL